MSMKRRDGYIAAISRKHITMTTLKSQWICSKHFVYIVFQSSFHRPAVHHHGVRNDETRSRDEKGLYTVELRLYIRKSNASPDGWTHLLNTYNE